MVRATTILRRRCVAALVRQTALWLMLCLCGTVLGDVTASLDRQSVPAGEGASLTIEITDGQAREPRVPEVPDLIIQPGGRSRQMSIVNGKVSSTTSFRYAVGSLKAGEYTVPPFTVMVDGVEMKTPPLKLKVTPSASQQPQGLPPGNAATPPTDEADSGEATGFLTVELAKKDRQHAWVGEIAPVRIKAWLPAGSRVSLNSRVQPEGSAFTLHNVNDQPQESMEVRNGKRYRVLTWYGGLSATKAGTNPPDLTLKATIAVRDPNSGRNRPRFPGGRDPFDDPFFDQTFARMIRKEVTLSSKNDAQTGLEVRALPTEGRPEGFSGAVGRFSLNYGTIPKVWKAGEPQQIAAAVTGSGNFNLLAQPDMSPAKNWKTYPGETDFVARDVASFEGTKTFKFNAVPRKGGVQDVHVQFSYFDPEKGRYETVQSPVQQIEVTGTAPVPVDEQTGESAKVPDKEAARDQLAPLHAEDSFVRSLTPPAFSPWFPAALGVAGAAIAAAVVLGRVRAVRGNADRIARLQMSRATQAALREAEDYAARGDTAAFFGAARRALQVRLAALWGGHAQAITLADVASRVPADSPVVEIFRGADLIDYSPAASLAGEHLAEWRTRLHEALNSLTTTPAV